MNTGLYWLFVLAGVLISGGLFLFSARRAGLSVHRAAAGFELGILLAACSAWGLCALLGLFSRNGGSPFAYPYRYSFVAGCAGFCLGPVLVCLRERERIPALLDRLAAPGCLLIAFMRFGEIWLGQWALADLRALGLNRIADGSFLARFPLSVRDEDLWYPAVSTVAAAAALIIGIVFFIRSRRETLPGREGLLFERCAFLLCAVGFFLEVTRLYCPTFRSVRTDQVLCGLIMLGLAVRAGFRLKKKPARFPIVSLLLLVLCFALSGLIQYVLENPWQFSSLFDSATFYMLQKYLKTVGYPLLLLTTVLPVLIHGRLTRK